jgi:hypothetical protein
MVAHGERRSGSVEADVILTEVTHPSSYGYGGSMNSVSPIPRIPGRRNYQASSLVVAPRPDEHGFVLREDEFQMLCDGEINEARAGRDLFLGLSLSAFVGLAGLAATTDWNAVFHQERWGPLLWMLSLVVLVAGPGAAAIVHHKRLTRTRDDSPYSRLRKRVSEYFQGQAP